MGFNMKVTPEIEALTKVCEENSKMYLFMENMM